MQAASEFRDHACGERCHRRDRPLGSAPGRRAHRGFVSTLADLAPTLAAAGRLEVAEHYAPVAVGIVMAEGEDVFTKIDC